jgi:probable blue pigment (indigoidine) exporter
MPLIVATLGWAVKGDRLPPLGILGLILGFAGVLLIMGTRVQGGVQLSGILLCIGGAIALAIATLSVKGASSGGNLLMIVGLQMLVGSLTLAPFALLESPPGSISPRALLAFAYQILIPGLAATVLWFTLVARIGTVRAAAYHFLNPFFGVAIAAWLLDEPIVWQDILGVVIIMAGIFAVQRARMATTSP